jgi:hypothetical protein
MGRSRNTTLPIRISASISPPVSGLPGAGGDFLVMKGAFDLTVPHNQISSRGNSDFFAPLTFLFSLSFVKLLLLQFIKNRGAFNLSYSLAALFLLFAFCILPDLRFYFLSAAVAFIHFINQRNTSNLKILIYTPVWHEPLELEPV